MVDIETGKTDKNCYGDICLFLCLAYISFVRSFAASFSTILIASDGMTSQTSSHRTRPCCRCKSFEKRAQYKSVSGLRI